MLDCAGVYGQLTEGGFDFFAGVPDSLMKDFCSYITDHAPPGAHVITANEGAAVALAAGHYLACGRAGVVYMQNSGLGNAVNPLVSLADPTLYGIPMLLFVGWRGHPDEADEPQHVHQGKVTRGLLQAMEVRHAELPTDPAAAESALRSAMATARDAGAPVALLVRKGGFAPYTAGPPPHGELPLTREAALVWLLDQLDARAVVVSTTGYTSRELWEHRRAVGVTDRADFLTIGSMGHASQVAMGIAARQRDRAVYCLDGDGAWIMHMGSVGVIGASQLKNLKHIVFNNGVHDSVGGQPTVGWDIDIPGVAAACGYTRTETASSQASLEAAFGRIRAAPGPCLLEVKVRPGARSDLGRPETSPQTRKAQLMKLLGS